MHECFTPWVASHHDMDPRIADLGYAPEIYPSQKITVAKEENQEFPIEAENIFIMRWLNGGLTHALGSAALATAFVEGFKRDTSQGQLHTAIIKRLSEGQNIALMTPHTDLNDVPLSLAGVALAIGDKNCFKHYGAIVNKLISRQAVESLPVSDRIRAFSSIYWVIPDTESTAKWGINEEIVDAVGKPAMRALREDRKTGGKLIAVAPTGTRAIETESNGLQLPPISKASFNLLSKFDAVLPVSIDAGTGNFAIGSLIETKNLVGASITTRETTRSKFADNITRLLGAYACCATGKEVEYNHMTAQSISIESSDASRVLREDY